MIDRLRAASQEVRAQLGDGRGTFRNLGDGVNALNAMAVIDQALDGIPDPKAKAKAETEKKPPKAKGSHGKKAAAVTP